MSKLLDLFFDLLFPPKCMFCGTLMDTSEDVVCTECLHSELPEVERELPKVQFFEKTVATFWYEEPIIGAILRFKFHGMSSYGTQFGCWLAGTVKDKLDGRFDVISWVPCSSLRRWSRGFDQAELLAKSLAASLGMEAIPTLKKIKHNPKQSRTKGAARRKANVLGVYHAYEPQRFQGRRVLLIDDVLTTGATLSECGKTLLMSGSGELVCAVIAAAHGDHNK